MSQRPISRSSDLQKLRNEGYDLEIRSGCLLVKDTPYVNTRKEVKRGILVMKLVLANDVTSHPDDHVAYFAGEYPCDEHGNEIAKIKNASGEKSLAEGVIIHHTFSAKPKPQDNYADYYAKVTTYVTILSGPAWRIDPTATAKTFPFVAPEADSDAEVMLRVKTGDDDAFGDLVRKYRRPMMHFMYRTTRTQAAAEDLAQEVFLRVYRSRLSYEASAKFTTWLYRIATNLAMNHARDTQHERPENTVSVDAKNEETGQSFDVADGSLTVEQHMVRRERMMAIRERVLGLPDKQRTAVLMHKYQGMEYRQIAEVLKLSESATKSLLFRAYETLREQLKEFA